MDPKNQLVCVNATVLANLSELINMVLVKIAGNDIAEGLNGSFMSRHLVAQLVSRRLYEQSKKAPVAVN